MKFIRYARGCTKSDKIRYDTMRSDLNIFSFNDKMEENKTKWYDHVGRMLESRVSEKLMNY